MVRTVIFCWKAALKIQRTLHVAKSLKLIIEALLFASDRPLSVKDIREWLPDADPANIRSALKVLKYEYEAFGRSFRLRDVGGGYQFRSHSEYGPYILRMLQSTPARISRAALETLAIVAYKQPIIRYEIEKIRGVDSGGILRNLLEKGLIRIMGRKDLPGRPLIYGTTRRFLEVFDLDSIGSLPKLKEIKAFGSEENGTQIQAFQESLSSPEELRQEEDTGETQEIRTGDEEPRIPDPEAGSSKPEETPED
jgi:segregation and condensation protein B